MKAAVSLTGPISAAAKNEAVPIVGGLRAQLVEQHELDDPESLSMA